MSKKVLYIHIGDAKTGSSTIQSKSTAYRPKLEENGVQYSKVGLLASHGIANHKLAFSVNADRPEYHHERASLYARLYEEANCSPYDKLLVSSEGFCSLRTRKEIADLYDMLTGFDVKIIAYVRRPDLWLESWYSQVVKNAPFSNRTFPEYLQSHQEPSLKTIIKYGDQFGFGNLIVRPFERSKLFCGDLYKDFLKCLNVSFEVPQSNNLNVSPDVYVTELFRNLNSSLSLADSERVALYRRIMKYISVSDTKHYFDPQSRLQFLSNYKHLIDELSSAFSSSGPLFDEFDPNFKTFSSCMNPKLDEVYLGLDKVYELLVSRV